MRWAKGQPKESPDASMTQGANVVDTDSYAGAVSEAGLSVRLDALVSQTEVADPPRAGAGLDLAATLTWLRSDIGGMRADLDALRTEVTGAQAWVVARAETPAPAVAPDTTERDASVDRRLAGIEDSLAELAERFESLASEGASDVGTRLTSVDERIAALAASIDDETQAAAQHRQHSAQAIAEQAAALDNWATATRSGLDELAGAVASSLEAFSSSMADARNVDRESERRHLDVLIAAVAQKLEASFLTLRTEVDDALEPIDGRLESLHNAVGSGFGDMRESLLEELGGAISRLEQANGVVHHTVEVGLAELRGDLADALDEVRDGVESTIGGARESIVGTLDEHRAASVELRDHVAASSAELRDDVTATSAQVRDDVLSGSRVLRDELHAVTGQLRAGIDVAAEHAQLSDGRVAELQTAVARLDATLSQLLGDWTPQVDAVIAQGRAAAHSVLEQVQAEVDAAIEEMSEALADQRAAISEVTGDLGGGTDRLVGAGQALLAYLAERDRELERERDRILHEVLDDFANGLSSKDRRAAASRLGEALSRRRDTRDAERLRRAEGAKPPLEIPPVPAEIAELSEPLIARPAVAEPPVDLEPPDSVDSGDSGDSGADVATAVGAELEPTATDKLRAAPAAQESSAPAKKAVSRPAAKSARTAARKTAQSRTAPAQNRAKPPTPAKRASKRTDPNGT
jgi:hypothetical protein